MAKVMVNGVVVAESDRCELVEGNPYFPPDSLKREYFQDSETHTTCGWKGVASYYNAVVDGSTIQDVAWYYPDPKPKAENIRDYVAFYRGKVQIEA
ncbi:MAG: DUF427 domain-containing protein [Microcoleaceae cyanobacterium]